MKREIEREKSKPIRDRWEWQLNAKNILYKGLLWYKLSNGLSWTQIAALLKEKGHKYSPGKLNDLRHNWGSNNIAYFFAFYDVFDIPTPTPELILYWDQEIKRMQAEKEARLRAKREEREAKRAARAGKR